MIERPDLDPGFWNEYQAPKNHISALVQLPTHKITAEALITAYMRDARVLRKSVKIC